VGRDPGEQYRALTAEFGDPVYARIDAPATRAQKAVLSALSDSDVTATTLAGDVIVRMMTKTLHLDAPIGGLKVVTEHGWFAARPSGTEEVYKLYAESFLGADHLARIQAEAQDLLSRAFAAAHAT
jgi:phosphoglucomutase